MQPAASIIVLESWWRLMELLKRLLVLASEGDFTGPYDPKDPPVTVVAQDEELGEEAK